MTSAAPPLRATGLGVRIDGRRLLGAVDLTLHAGALTAVVGPNGAGKSTLLRALAGDLTCEGTVELAGRPLRSWSAMELARLRAVLPQDGTIAFPFRTREVVAMGRAPWHRTPAAGEDDDTVAWAMEATGVAPLAERRVPSLSGGERAAVMLARVLAQRAGVLLLDEPAAALDPHRQELVLRLLKRQARNGCAVLVVLHDLTAAGTHADRIVLLAGGTVRADGPPAEVLTEPLLTTAYGAPLEVVTHPRSGAPIVLPR